MYPRKKNIDNPCDIWSALECIGFESFAILYFPWLFINRDCTLLLSTLLVEGMLIKSIVGG